jgi:hypothetical protein
MFIDILLPILIAFHKYVLLKKKTLQLFCFCFCFVLFFFCFFFFCSSFFLFILGMLCILASVSSGFWVFRGFWDCGFFWEVLLGVLLGVQDRFWVFDGDSTVFWRGLLLFLGV